MLAERREGVAQKRLSPQGVKKKQVELRPVERSSTVNVSGTKMRKWLEDGDKEAFVKNLPSSIDKDAVWDILSATAKNPPKLKATARAKTATKKKQAEGLVRSYVRMLVGARL